MGKLQKQIRAELKHRTWPDLSRASKPAFPVIVVDQLPLADVQVEANCDEAEFKHSFRPVHPPESEKLPHPSRSRHDHVQPVPEGADDVRAVGGGREAHQFRHVQAGHSLPL